MLPHTLEQWGIRVETTVDPAYRLILQNGGYWTIADAMLYLQLDFEEADTLSPAPDLRVWIAPDAGFFLPCGQRETRNPSVKYWEIIADNLHDAGFSLGWVSAIDSKERTIWVVDAHRGGKRFVVHADEKLTAFGELQRAVLAFAVSLISSQPKEPTCIVAWLSTSKAISDERIR